MSQAQGKQWLNIKNFGLKGLNFFDEPSSVDDSELIDGYNFSIDGGFLSPSLGSTLLTAKPDGAGNPLQLIIARTSDGVTYKIGVYDDEFYLYHPDNEEWIKINQTYDPTETTLHYGWVNWNNGRGDDRLYVCNGVDDMARWDICVDTIATTAAAGAATVTLTDGTRFPAGGGTLILKADDGSFFTEAYTSRTGNVFTLTGTTSKDITAGASATLDMIQKASMAVGKILVKSQNRLFVSNYYGGEVVVSYSVVFDPEDFTVTAGNTDGDIVSLTDGYGEIKAIHEFGSFLIVEKEDSAYRLEIKLDVNADAEKLTAITPVLSGQSLGTLSQQATVKTPDNRLAYPTRTNGFLSMSPAGTGNTTSVVPQTISQNIQPYITNLFFDDCKGVVFDQKLIWSVGLPNSSANSIVLIYDLLRNAWSIRKNWAVKDWGYDNGDLFYMDVANGDIIQVFTPTYDDRNEPYEVKAYSKRFDFGVPAVPKTEDYVYVQGIIDSTSDFYIDVLMNEAGILRTQTYRINKSVEGIFLTQVPMAAAGQFIRGLSILGGITDSELSFFRCYLPIDIRKGWYNLQVVVRSNHEAFWAVTGLAYNPVQEQMIPAEYVIEPI